MSEADVQKVLPEADWRKQAKDKETAKPAMGVTRLSVIDGRLIEGEDTVHKNGLELLPLAGIYARAYYSKPYNKAEAAKSLSLPDCYSTSASKDFVGVSPEANSPAIQADTCANCSLGSWDKSGWDAGQKAPKCGTRRNTLMKDLGTGKIYRLSIPPTGTKAFDQYWGSLSGPLAGTTVKVTADGKIPAFEKGRDLNYDEYMRHAEPYIGEAERLLRAPINFDAAKEKDGAGPGGNEAPIVPGAAKAPAAPAGKPRF